MIDFKNVTFKYKKGDMIFEDLSYSFKKGNIYIISGENGVGKTTLAKLILKILTPVSGTIIYNGISKISYLPDYSGIYPQLTILENIKYRLALYDLSYESVELKIKEMCKKFGIEKYINNMVSTLSLGTQKKAAILCSAIVSADLLVLDEPTGGLDKNSSREVSLLLEELKTEDTIVICISHDRNLLCTNYANKINVQDGILHEYE